MKRATPSEVLRRVEELLRIRLDGAEFWDVREYVREKEKVPGSAWLLAEGDNPLSDSQMWKYVCRADAEIEKSAYRSRKRLLKHHAAKRRNLYAKAVAMNDIARALACLDSEANLLGLAKPRRHEFSGPKGGKIPTEVTHRAGESLRPYLALVLGLDADLEGAPPEDLRRDGPAEPLDTPEAPGTAGPVPHPTGP